ncbi:MAG: ATP-binding protein [Lachnospiraceae bacterium]|nr:ATP-binding protein [Lachnospiraceae bacterium]
MKYRPLPIGISDFAEMIRKEFYYVDKTPMIKELLDNQAKVTLFTRPRRFGKTLNMSMLKYYFEDDRDWQGNRRDWADLFDRLKIMEAGESYLAHRGQYPVIYLTFKDSKRESFERSYTEMARVIAEEFGRHRFMLEDPAMEEYQEKFLKMMRQEGSRNDYETSILFLSRCMEICYGRKAVVLIDEYDVPLENAFTCGFYNEMVNFIRALFESGLKDNTSLGFSAVTGCLRVSKESIFTGLNNLNIVSVRSTSFDEYFGFKVDEVEEMCLYYDLDDKYDTVKDWYNGYTFGQTDIYNPWSVIKYIYDARPHHDWLPMSYWANTSSNSVVKTLIDQAGDEEREKIETLLAGGTIVIQIHEDITYNEIYDEGDNLWNFMFFTGYFRKVREWMEEEIIYAELMIPNKEVRYIFNEKVLKWFHEKRKNRDMHPLHDAVIAKDCAVMTEEINDIFGETISYMDQNEFYYHGMMAGLLTGIKGYTVRSNRESGKGRSDLLVKPIRRSREAFVIEFKVTKDFQELDQKADEAIRQIVDRKYEMELINDGYKYISYYGIAFCGKECVVHCKPYE